MRAKDYIEIHKSEKFYNDLKRVLIDLFPLRKDWKLTKEYFDKYLINDVKHAEYIVDFNELKLNNSDNKEEPKFIEIKNSINRDDASDFRKELFPVTFSDDSYGYLYYLIIKELSDNNFYYNRNFEIDVDDFPRFNVIESAIINYQDDYPKNSLDDFLTYNEINYNFYKSNKKITHSKDFWLSVFTSSYDLFDELRTRMHKPLLAFDTIKIFSEKNKRKKILIITLLLDLLTQYNYDLSEEQQKGKVILVDEINDYLKLLVDGKIPPDPEIRTISWLSEHPELMTKEEQNSLTNTSQIINNFFEKANRAFPSFDLVRSKLDGIPDIEEKIILLEDVISTWEVNISIAEKHRNDDTAKQVSEKPISLFKDMLDYWKKMQELQNRKLNVSSKVIDKTKSFIDIDKEKGNNILGTKEIFDSGFIRAFIEEYYEEKIHSYYPEKDKLLYIMCSSHIEKHEVTKKQIETIKSEIHKLGWEELSVGYLQSCKPESGPNFIEPGERFDFWLNSFSNEIQDNVETFCPVFDTQNKLNNDSSFNKKLADNNGEFWNLIHKDLRPKNQNFMLEDLVELEIDLVNQIEYDIEEYKVNNSWEFDFEEYEKYIETNKAIEDLFNISELLVQLNRLEMFQEFLILAENKITDENQSTATPTPQKAESKIEMLKADLFKYGFFEISKVKSLSHDGQLKLLEILKLNKAPYIVAMLDYLGFFKHLTNEHSFTNIKIHKTMSACFDVDPQTIKCNMLALNENSALIENNRYTSYKHKEKVKTDYNSLK